VVETVKASNARIAKLLPRMLPFDCCTFMFCGFWCVVIELDSGGNGYGFGRASQPLADSKIREGFARRLGASRLPSPVDRYVDPLGKPKFIHEQLNFGLIQPRQLGRKVKSKQVFQTLSNQSPL
jgi:hypothetical protein